jgi:hypothetical protein
MYCLPRRRLLYPVALGFTTINSEVVPRATYHWESVCSSNAAKYHVFMYGAGFSWEIVTLRRVSII